MQKIKKVHRRAEVSTVKKSISNFFTHLKLGESYVSLVLGLLVVIISLILVVSFVRNNKTKEVSSTSTQENVTGQIKNIELPTTYTVKSGDTLWGISENFYKSGYNWIEISRVNNLNNPNLIHSGNVLNIPNIKPTDIDQDLSSNTQVEQNTSVSGDSYIVVKDDSLWNIAVRAYGDGFKWAEIAKANNLSNPGLIFSDNVLKIPR